MTALSTLINEYLRTNNLSQTGLVKASGQLGNDERTAKKYYIRESHDGPAVADLLQGLVMPGMRLVENSA